MISHISKLRKVIYLQWIKQFSDTNYLSLCRAYQKNFSKNLVNCLLVIKILKFDVKNTEFKIENFYLGKKIKK